MHVSKWFIKDHNLLGIVFVLKVVKSIDSQIGKSERFDPERMELYILSWMKVNHVYQWTWLYFHFTI